MLFQPIFTTKVSFTSYRSKKKNYSGRSGRGFERACLEKIDTELILARRKYGTPTYRRSYKTVLGATKML